MVQPVGEPTDRGGDRHQGNTGRAQLDAAGLQRQAPAFTEAVREVGDQVRLAHTGRPADHDDPRHAGGGVADGSIEVGQLFVPAHEHGATHTVIIRHPAGPNG